MRTVLLLLLTSATTSVAAQPLVTFPEPTGEWRRLCTSHDAIRVCRIVEDGAAHLVVSRDGREVTRWETPNSVQAGGFGAFSSDLDRDGERDLVILERIAVSNGIAISTWIGRVLPQGARTPAYTFQLRDASATGGSFGHDGDRLVFWATTWANSPDPSGQRGIGYYFVGRPFTLTSRGMRPYSRLPVRARRLLESFQRERHSQDGPNGWLSDRRAESRRVDPVLSGCRQQHEPVTVRSVREATERDARYFVLDVGREITYLKGGFDRDDEDITHLGDASTGRLFPREYRPAGLAQTLAGRDLRLTTCAEKGGTQTRVLWL
ncbi:MAG: hypothetical protein AAGI52_11970 [Bacteroidota bacterium]